MKRIKFLSGISAMCAFAVIALAGSLMTSCDKEDFKGTFETKPAEAVINVTVTDLSTGASVSSATISASAGTVSGTTVTLKGTAADGSLSAQPVTISATAAGYTIQPATVNVQAMSAGSYAVYAANLFAVKEGGDEPEAEIKWTSSEAEEDAIVYELLDPTHSHAADNQYWGENANDYTVKVPVSCTIYNVVELVSNDISDADAKAEAEARINALCADNSAAWTWEFEVPGWSTYRAWQTVTPVLTTWTATRNDEKLGSFVVRATTANVFEYYWEYIAGHGHDHGHGGSNSGGGIVTPD